MPDREIIDIMEEAAARINRPDFIESDPVRFPRRFTDLRDIEITALLVSAIAWGNRKMILRDAERMLSLMDNQPYKYVSEQGYEELPDGENIHRTFFTNNFKHFLRGLRSIYETHGSLEAFGKSLKFHESEFPAWELANGINERLRISNEGRSDSRCLPLNLDVSALKRLNMALRWLVRNDGIVDLGVWTALSPSQLYIPLDVHVGRISRDLGLLSRRSNDRKAVVELTDVLRQLRPDDPVYYDFALFGMGVNETNKD